MALTEEGVLKVERCSASSNLYDAAEHRNEPSRAAGAEGARPVPARRDYVVKDGEVIIVDEFTGRMMPGRRWSDGLHQAVEAKEGVKIERENQTLATITFQNYFRMYKKLAGMTGTADTEAAEFEKIYKLEVTSIPTNRPLLRIENAGRRLSHGRREVPQRRQGNQGAARERAAGAGGHGFGRKIGDACPAILKKMGVRHEVLNAKNHEREAYIVAQAGRKGAVTVSTNMAGRGTDILLGGNAGFHDRASVCARRTKIPMLSATESSAEWDAVFGEIQGADPKGARRSGGARRPAHFRHRAPRIAAHR